MCLDIGLKHTGIAFSDPNRIYSVASKVINNYNKKLVNQLTEIVKSYNLCGIIVGVPLNDDNSINKKTQSIKDTVKHIDLIFLKNNIELPILFWDESYSSENALENIKFINKFKSNNKRIVDKFAAQSILQDFLDYKNKL